MLFKCIMTLVALAIATLATPVDITFLPKRQILSKRATPDFKKGDYTKQQITQIKQGHADAIKMASTAVTWSKSSERFDPIFNKYFNIQDRDAVVGKDCPWSWVADNNRHANRAQTSSSKLSVRRTMAMDMVFWETSRS